MTDGRVFGNGAEIKFTENGGIIARPADGQELIVEDDAVVGSLEAERTDLDGSDFTAGLIERDDIIDFDIDDSGGTPLQLVLNDVTIGPEEAVELVVHITGNVSERTYLRFNDIDGIDEYQNRTIDTAINIFDDDKITLTRLNQRGYRGRFEIYISGQQPNTAAIGAMTIRTSQVGREHLINGYLEPLDPSGEINKIEIFQDGSSDRGFAYLKRAGVQEEIGGIW